MFKRKNGRHYWFARNLIEKGYAPTIFCASTIHNSSENINTGNGNYVYDTVDNIPFVFIKSSNYLGNGMQRIKNIIAFYRNFFPVTKKYAKCNTIPDIIIASSPHLLTLVAGIKIAKRLNIPCICEVRDLWPESLVAYGILKKNSIMTRILYQGEKWIYRKADSIIMTWEGGKDYIINKGWEKQIDLKKICYISNGVAIDSFDRQSIENNFIDPDLDNKEYKNVVYTGSIRRVNNLSMLLDAARIIKNKGIKNIRFLIYGSGNESEILKKKCREENIDNVIFNGYLEWKFVPSVFKKADINILHNSSTILNKYGQSQNKLFEYLAAGKCIIQTYTNKYSVCKNFNCGICVPVQNPKEIADAVIMACVDETKRQILGKNAREASYEFDYPKLTKKLIDVIERIG